ncbi:MAG: UpxY family transcription antiterminator [Flavobacteriaceae bacterium]|nr:UpxY family transcription antiterminator [Flavobacteriaceae bacterium]
MKKSTTSWFAIYTAPRAEKKVFQRLESVGYIVYLPLLSTVKQWSDRKKKVEIPLISSYVFVKIELLGLSKLRGVPGVVGVLKYLGKPAAVKEVEINNLKILVREQQHVKVLTDIQIPKGTPIQVINGQMKGVIGELVHYKGKVKVIVRVEACATLVEVEVPLSFVEKI